MPNTESIQLFQAGSGTATATVQQDTGLTVLARIIDPTSGDYLQQADVSEIDCVVRNRQTEAIVGTSGVTVTSAIFDALQTDDRWSADSTGYNFRHQVPASLLSNPNKAYVVDYTFSPTTGEDFSLGPIKITTSHNKAVDKVYPTMGIFGLPGENPPTATGITAAWADAAALVGTSGLLANIGTTSEMSDPPWSTLFALYPSQLSLILSDDPTGGSYVDDIKTFIDTQMTTTAPRYMTIASEESTAMAADPTAINAAYHVVKSHFPSATVSASFAYDAAVSAGDVATKVALYEHMDAIFFTTYPWAASVASEDATKSYYQQLRDTTDKRLVAVECGWSSEAAQSQSTAAQAEGIHNVFTAFAELNIEAAVYWNIDDLPWWVDPFKELGIRTAAGAEKAAYAVFERFVSLGNT